MDLNNIFNEKFTKLSFIDEYKDEIDWYTLSSYKLNDDIINKYHNFLVWQNLLYNNLNLKLIDKYSYLLDDNNWEFISLNYNYDLKFIKKYSNKLNWKYISSQIQLSEDFIMEFQDKVYWRLIAIFQKILSEKFIENNICKLKYHNNHKKCKIHPKETVYQNLSESFILKYRNEFDYNDWEIISAKQKLTEKFIIKFKNKIHFNKLGAEHPLDLSIDFLHTNKHNFNWHSYFKNHKKLYTKKFLLDFLCYVDDLEIKHLALKRHYIGKLDNLLCKDICLHINSFI